MCFVCVVAIPQSAVGAVYHAKRRYRRPLAGCAELRRYNQLSNGVRWEFKAWRLGVKREFRRFPRWSLRTLIRRTCAHVRS